jgi:hypothetical protein
MTKVRFFTSALLFSVVIWALTFWALAAPVRISHFQGNKYPYIFSSWMHQSFIEADEELITVTCLTLWAVAWGTFFAAVAFSENRSHIFMWTAICAAVVFAAWFVGVAFLRHLFSVEIDHYFHIFYSITVAIFAWMFFRMAVRDPAKSDGALSANMASGRVAARSPLWFLNAVRLVTINRCFSVVRFYNGGDPHANRWTLRTFRAYSGPTTIDS